MSDKDQEDQGGYMRSLHTLEEKIYGPKSTLENKAKVFLCVRHNTLRWDIEIKEITYSFIVRKTGVAENRVVECVKRLEKEKLLSVLRRKQNNQFLPNIIGLNKKFFGELLEKEHAPNFKIIEGGKSQKLSPQTADLSTGHRNSGDGGHRNNGEGVHRNNGDENRREAAPIAGMPEPKELRERTNLKEREEWDELDASGLKAEAKEQIRRSLGIEIGMGF